MVDAMDSSAATKAYSEQRYSDAAEHYTALIAREEEQPAGSQDNLIRLLSNRSMCYLEMRTEEADRRAMEDANR